MEIKILANKNFIFNNTPYIKGEEVKINNIEQVNKLNELGYIEPLTYEELVKLKRELNDKEEAKWTGKI